MGNGNTAGVNRSYNKNVQPQAQNFAHEYVSDEESVDDGQYAE